eukprot:3495347-Lingulodinium_polyedra.AAC.1
MDARAALGPEEPPLCSLSGCGAWLPRRTDHCLSARGDWWICSRRGCRFAAAKNVPISARGLRTTSTTGLSQAQCVRGRSRPSFVGKPAAQH